MALKISFCVKRDCMSESLDFDAMTDLEKRAIFANAEFSTVLYNMIQKFPFNVVKDLMKKLKD